MITYHRKMAAVAQSRGLAVASADGGSRGYNFRAGTHKWAGSELGRILRVVVGLVLVIAAYVTVIALYHSTGLGRPHEVAHGRPTADGTTVTLHVEQLQTIKGVLVANLAVSPGTELLDSQTQGLKDDLTVTVTSVVTPTKRTWSSGSLPGVFPVPLTISGDPANWPFDHYRSGPITVQLYRGAAHAPERVGDIRRPASGLERRHFRCRRRQCACPVPSGVAPIAEQRGIRHRHRRCVDRAGRGGPVRCGSNRTWPAAIPAADDNVVCGNAFAVIPLRNALPDAPPIGFWIDVTVVLWVVVALVTSMVLYILCWWWHLKPDVDETM